MTAFNSTKAATELTLNVPQPFDLQVDDGLLDITKQKLSLSRYPEEQSDVGPEDWSQGAKVNEVRRLAEYWQNEYDWRVQERKIKALANHYLVNVQVPGYGPVVIHYLHKRSKSPDAIPLLFCHGWPGSFLEARYVLDGLAASSPEHNGIGFDIVVPSIPGFGFSPAPHKTGVGPSIVARAYKILMVEVLRYDKGFVTQGGDFGSFISRSIAIQYPKLVIAQHLNMFPVPPPTIFSAPRAYLRWCLAPLMYTKFEKTALKVRRNFELDQSGYLEQQKTRPQTLGFALGDSPLGLLAWFVEKFHDWVDFSGSGNLSDADTIDLVMMHWLQGSTPGLRFYREAFWAGRRDADETFEIYVAVPTGVSMYAQEQLHCPRDWASQAAKVVFWREHDLGGHFSSLERPEQFIEDMRTFFSSSPVRKSIVSHLGRDIA